MLGLLGNMSGHAVQLSTRVHAQVCSTNRLDAREAMVRDYSKNKVENVTAVVLCCRRVPNLV